MTRVLLIEPIPAERDRLALCLRHAGFSVRSAGDAATGLQAAREWAPEVIVAPPHLSTADGTRLLDALRAEPRTCHAGIVSILPSGDADIRSAVLDGADDALPAPVTETLLVGAVRARARRAAAMPVPAEAPDAALEGIAAALEGCARPATVALAVLQDANALAAVAGQGALQEFDLAWRARVHALAPDASGVFTVAPGEVALVLPPRTPQLRALLAAVAGTGQIPVRAAGMDYRARAAVGCTTVEKDEPTPPAATLLRRCRFALDIARRGSHPQVHAYAAHEAQETLNDLALATLIQHAAEEGRFQLVYQPKVAIPSGRVTGVEALIRWNMPTGESVAPERLLAVADNAGLLDEVATWALREACRQAARWTHAGLRMNMSVNIAGGQFRRGDFVDEARMALSESGLQGDQLMVEVSESTLAQDTGSVREQLAEVRVTGIRVCIEDVGAGALALPVLRTLTLDELKIDRSLVAHLPGTLQDRATADLILREARELGVPCVAEGVEHAAQWAYLAEHGWDCAQGWLISRPMAPELVPAFVASAESQADVGIPTEA